MYIKKLIYKNVGPIASNNIDFRFTEDGRPVPVVIVGENGSGKSMFLSNITDAFYELAGTAYDNALQSEGQGHQYYKVISSDQISIGFDWLVAYMEFEHNSECLKYIFKSGKLSYSDFVANESIQFDSKLDWKEEHNAKKVVCEKNQIKDIFNTSIVASFSPMRYEKPFWMGEKYHRSRDEITFSHNRQYNGYLYNPISVECDFETTLSWLFDIIADSRADLEKKSSEEGYTIVYPTTSDIDLLSISRKNAEQLMSAILGKSVILRMGNRSNKGRRLQICDNKGNTLIPSLDALSTGQLALFNMFSSIIRYADNDNINLSFRLNEITGIVLIDEIELHLHSKLQREVLPRLISLFPKVQFIITSHSPLFLLGLQERYGEDNIDIFEMPAATKINAEDFSEFGKAYQYYSDTQKYRTCIRTAIDSANTNGKSLVITEGSTDWKLMKAAYNALISDDRCKEWQSQLDFEFLEYEPQNSSKADRVKLQMSCSELVEMCKNYSKIKNSRKMIFIADNDDAKTKKALNGSPYKNWDNDVYSFCLPVPRHRSNSDICIEHLFRDEELKREVSSEGDIKRRLFLGSEFDKSGHLESDGAFYFCSAMQGQKERDKNAIVDGSDNKKVIKVGDSRDVNYALPKSKFADYVLEKKEPFAEMNFDAFIPIFEIIREILNGEAEIK